MFNEKTQKINVTTSTGQKLKGTVGGMVFEAPGIVEVQRTNSDKLFLTEDPKCNKTTIATKSIDMTFFVTLLLSWPSTTTDYATEKMWKYQDTVVISCQS